MTPAPSLFALVLSARAAAADVAPLGGPLAAVPWALPASVPAPEPVPEPAWADRPVTRDVHPVGLHYGARYQELVAALMGGPRASPVFGPIVAEADVHWRLLDATGVGLRLDPEAPDRWSEAALAGSLLAIERLADETLQRAPTLYGVYVAGDTLLSPSFDVRAREETVELAHRPGGAAARSLERREEELAMGRPRGKPTPSFGAGLDWELRDEEAPDDAPLVRYTAWFATTELWLSSFRLEIAPLNLAWTASGRQRLGAGVFAIATARSDERGPEPGRLSGGLMWLPPGSGTCNVRAEHIVDYLAADTRWMLTLRCENRTPVPAPLAPPLGDRGRPGPVLPWAPDRAPPTLVPDARSRVLPTSTSAAPR